MNQKIDEQLCKKYPKIFAQRGLPMNQTAMCWGFQCGDGWYTLINSLCFLIQAHIDGDEERVTRLNEWRKKHRVLSFLHWVHYPLYRAFDRTLPKEIRKCNQVEATTVKEKFGGLRFYVNGGDRATEAYIHFAEFLSNSVCEDCGATIGVTQTSGWVYTRCPSCLDKQDKIIKGKPKNGADSGRSKTGNKAGRTQKAKSKKKES